MTFKYWHLFPWIYLLLIFFISPNHHYSWFNAICLLSAFTGIFLHYFKPKDIILNFLKLLFLAFGIITLFFSPWNFASIEMGSNILLLLCILKTYELNSQRDSIIFCAMAHLLFITALLNLDQLYYLPLVLLSPPVFFSYIHRSSSHHRVPGISQFKLFSMALFISAFFFFLFPRFQFGGINWFSHLQIGLTGHQERMIFEDFSKQLLDPTVVFRAELDQALAYNQLYWKGATLHSTDGKDWERGHFRGILRKYLIPKLNYQVYFELPYRGDLFTLDGTAKVRINRYSNAINGANENWSAITAGQSKLHFSAEVWRYQDGEINPKSYQHLISVPDSLPLLWKARSSSPADTVKELINYFSANGFVYDIKAPSGQSVLELLQKNKKGHCAHYASAAALMLRQNKIPARIVVGYHGGEFNPLGNYYVIRQLDAHAWTEFWDGRKWVTLDLTTYLAPTRLSEGADAYFDMNNKSQTEWSWLNNDPAMLFKRIKLVVDLAYYRVNTRFSNYDAEEQRKLFQKFKTVELSSGKLMMTITLLGSLISAIILALVIKKRRLARSPWNLLLQKLSAQGVILEKNITPNRLAKKYSFPELQQITQEIEQNSFSNQEIDQQKLLQRIKKLKYPF